MRDTAVGIDIGTTSVKSIVISAAGEILFEKSISHDLISEFPGFAEEDPETWWDSCQLLLKDLSSRIDCKRIAALAFSGMVPTTILLDSDGNPLRNSIQQNDARAVAEIAEWKSSIDEDAYFKRTGNTINQQVIFPKFDWLKTRQPELVDKTSYIMGSYNFAAFRATGVPSVDNNWALESGYWKVRDQDWDEEIVTRSGIGLERLPPVKNSGDVIGYTTSQLEKKTGFPQGIPVLAGIADHVASALSTGVREEGDLLLKLGGAGDILYASQKLQIDERMFIDYHPVKGTYLINGCMAASGSIVKWLMGMIKEDSIDYMNGLAEKLPPGSGDLVFLPYMLGEKTPIFDTDARGVYFGLNLSHTRAHLFRAVLESVAFGFMHHIEVLDDMGLNVKRVFLSNGGAKSPVWKKIVLDVIGCDGSYMANHPGSCLGAALLALESRGVSRNWKTLDYFLDRAMKIPHSPENHIRYKKYYDIYRELYERLQPLFPELHKEEKE